jgi:hypothetical protein
VGEIHGLLARNRARSISTEYDGAGNPTAIAFRIETAYGDARFRLPARLDQVWKVMTKQYQQGKVPRRFATREQAARVGWRIILTWLQAQLALIESDMVDLGEVMLPYALDRSGKTFYELAVKQHLALPEPKEREE